MSKSICKFYARGHCKFGSSCRFSHSEHSNNQYYDEYRPRKNANRDYNYDNYNDGKSYDQHYAHYNQSDIVNYHSQKDYNSSNKYNRKYDNQNYNSHKNYDDGDYHSNYNSNDNNYQNSKQKESYVRNYNEYDKTGNDYMYSNHGSNGRNFKDHNVNNEEHFTNSYRRSKDRNNYKHDNQEKEYKLKKYDSDIKAYQTHVQQLLNSNIWPLTCYQPIGSLYPIQPVGSLNLPDVSFEEIRCDFYILKYMVGDPQSVHKHCVDELLFKSQQLKRDILSFEDYIQTDMLATFDKCEQSKMNNPSFQNSIQADPNIYWNMSQRYLINPEVNKAQMEAFSFVIGQETTQKAPSLKILMQVETYGQVDSEVFAQEQFTDFIPIMPPPRKSCL